MYLVFAEWEGDVSYGIDSSTYLLAIEDNEDDAMDVLRSIGAKPIDHESSCGEDWQFVIPDDKRAAFEEKYKIVKFNNDGWYLAYYREYRPGMFCG